jgi:phosphoglycerate dehydrogenase-like enzyme
LFRLLLDCDIVWHVLQRCTREMIAAAPRLKLIQKIGVGVNTIDLDAAKLRGIPVCNLPGTNARAVAELTLGLMLSVLRRIPAFDQNLRTGTWTDTGLQDGIGELGGRTVGLVGFGAISSYFGTDPDGDRMRRDLHLPRTGQRSENLIQAASGPFG